jgi:hypothetical protein
VGGSCRLRNRYARLPGSFQCDEFRSWKNSNARLQLLLDGFDTCLDYVKTLVALLRKRLAKEPLDRLTLRIACRTGDWPTDLEQALKTLWPDENGVLIYQLAPLRRKDVRAAAEAKGLDVDGFLDEVFRLGAGTFASRPITLKFMLNTFERNRGFPAQRPELYRKGCLALCEEWREDLRRSRKFPQGARFSVASRLAAVSVFSRKISIWSGSYREVMPDGDVRVDELLGGAERFLREVTHVTLDVVRETLDTGLFRSLGPHRIGFSHQTYSEFLAAQYLVDHGMGATEILRLILHRDGSGKVVSHLRETVGWLAAVIPEVLHAVLSTDPASLLACDTSLASDADRRALVLRILQLFDAEEFFDIELLATAGNRQDGARLKYAEIAGDLKPYILDKSKRSLTRCAAILMARFTRQAELQGDLVSVATDHDDFLEVRVAAAMAIRLVGNETSRVGLKGLATDPSIDDPSDELKGAALAATWPESLTADELFHALTPPKRLNFIGEYQRFLTSNFASKIVPADMIRGLQWAQIHAPKVRAEHTLLRNAAFRIVTEGIDDFNDTEVCKLIANILIENARSATPAVERKLASNFDARIAIARVAMRIAADYWSLWWLRRVGLIVDGDIPFLLDEFEASQTDDVREKIAFLIANILDWGPRPDEELIERIFVVGGASKILSAALMPVLGYVNLDSEEAERQKDRYRALLKPEEPASRPEPTLTPNLDDLLSQSNDVLAFLKICHRLTGNELELRNGVLPGWNQLTAEVRNRIMDAGRAYLNGYCVSSTAWMDLSEIWFAVTCGYWALRVLAQVEPRLLDELSGDVWYAWMPSVFGDHYREEVPDDVHTAVLKTAYRLAPARFRELIDRFIDSQNRVSGEVFMLDRTKPVWDHEIAELLRSRLQDSTMSPKSFGRILDALMKAEDAEALRIAKQVVVAAKHASPQELKKPIQAALELVTRNPSEGWKVIWPVVQTNDDFAKHLFSHYAIDPFSADAVLFLDGLGANELAEWYIWLSEHTALADGDEPRRPSALGGFEMHHSNNGWYWLSTTILNRIILSGLPGSVEAVRRLDRIVPDHKLKPVVSITQEVAREKAWMPPSPSELIELVSGSSPGTIDGGIKKPRDLESETIPGTGKVDTKPTLAARLAEAEKVSDLKLRDMYVAVIRYQWYFAELRELKIATKKHQTPDLLKQRFPDFELWAILERADIADIIDGAFTPGRFSWSLIKRLNGLDGKDDRTLKNYRRALRAAGISV